MSGTALALKIITEYNTNNVFTLARQAGVTIIYEKWYPITYGEFHKKTKTIYVNLNAPIEKKHIIAHELGHYFSELLGNNLNKIEEEKIAEDFAECMKIVI